MLCKGAHSFQTIRNDMYTALKASCWHGIHTVWFTHRTFHAKLSVLWILNWNMIWTTLAAEFCPELSDPIGGTQMCKDWGSGGQFKVCEIACNAGLRFSQPVPKFYTCGAEGFWRPTSSPTLPLVYPACTGKCGYLVMHFYSGFPFSVFLPSILYASWVEYCKI
jgi:hypothetical protein